MDLPRSANFERMQNKRLLIHQKKLGPTIRGRSKLGFYSRLGEVSLNKGSCVFNTYIQLGFPQCCKIKPSERITSIENFTILLRSDI